MRFRFPLARAGEGSAFTRVMRPQGVALPILALAVWMRVSDGVVDEVRIALGPAGPVPLRATTAETYLTGIPLVRDVIPQMADLIFAGARLRSSKHRASVEYREELILPLARRALTLAYERAQEAPTL